MRGRKPNPTVVEPRTVVPGPWTGVGPILEQPDWMLRHVDGAWGERRAEIAAERWAELVASMTEKGTLDRDNGPLVEMAAVAYADWKLAEAHVATHGPVVPAPNTGTPMHNPYRTIADAAFKRLMSAERDLGIPPIERGRVSKAPPRARKTTAADEFLAAAKK